MSKIKIFYIWQGQRDHKTNKDFIRKALDEAAEQASIKTEIEDIEIDQDVYKNSGSPPITEIIIRKIHQSDLIVVDLTVIGKTDSNEKDASIQFVQSIANFNVGYEAGFFDGLFAKSGLDYEEKARTIFVINEYYGSLKEQLAFDIKDRKVSCIYNLNPNARGEEIELARQKVKNDLLNELIQGVLYVSRKKSLSLKLPGPENHPFSSNGTIATIIYNQFIGYSKKISARIFWPKPPFLFINIEPSFKPFLNEREIKRIIKNCSDGLPFPYTHPTDEGTLIIPDPEKLKYESYNQDMTFVKNNGGIWGINTSFFNRPIYPQNSYSIISLQEQEENEAISLDNIKNNLETLVSQHLSFVLKCLKIKGLVDIGLGMNAYRGMKFKINAPELGGTLSIVHPLNNPNSGKIIQSEIFLESSNEHLKKHLDIIQRQLILSAVEKIFEATNFGKFNSYS